MRRGFWRLGVGLALLVACGRTSSAAAPSYHRDVEPILQKHCQDCHRPGQVAPFSLLTYEQARKRSADIAGITEEHKMPPWPASTHEGGPFRDARVLTGAEIAMLAAWNEAGSPEGSAADAPTPRKFDSDWALGKPDLVLTVSQAYHLSDSGRDELRVFVLPTGLKEGKWISAIDFRPGNTKVVHHILCAFDMTGQARQKDEADPEPGYSSFGGFGILPSGGLSGWAPGKRPQPLADGVGRYLPAGADVLLQIHYHKNGKREDDASSVALYFADKPVEKQVRGAAVFPPRASLLSRPALLIPAGDANYEVKGEFEIKYDAHATSVTPHMHWLGKDFLLTATRPDGSKVSLIKVDDWDFNWQGNYEFVEPVALPAGSKVQMLAHFDNSAKNPDNPNSPPKDMRWGEQTTDEMCIGFLQLTTDKEHLNNRPPARFARPAGAQDAPAKAAAFRRLLRDRGR